MQRCGHECAFDPETLIDAMGPMLGLDIAAEYRAGVVANLRIAAAMAALVLSEPLGDHAEPAPVFTPEPAAEGSRHD